MIKMLTPCTFHCFYASLVDTAVCFHTDVEDGNITAVLSNPAITVGLLSEIKSWYAEGATVNDVVERLRL